MDKVLKPFVVLTTYVVLYALTYSVISAIFSAVFWLNYFDVIHSFGMIILLIIAVAAHSLYAIVESDK